MPSRTAGGERDRKGRDVPVIGQRTHLVLLAAWTLLWFAVVEPHGGFSWHYLRTGGELIYGGAGGGLNLYAHHPELQMGPVSFLVAGLFDPFPERTGQFLAAALMSFLGLVILVLVGRSAATHLLGTGTNHQRLRQRVLVAGLAFIPMWIEVSVRFGHLDDVLALFFTTLAVRSLTRGKVGLGGVDSGAGGAGGGTGTAPADALSWTARLKAGVARGKGVVRGSGREGAQPGSVSSGSGTGWTGPGSASSGSGGAPYGSGTPVTGFGSVSSGSGTGWTDPASTSSGSGSAWTKPGSVPSGSGGAPYGSGTPMTGSGSVSSGPGTGWTQPGSASSGFGSASSDAGTVGTNFGSPSSDAGTAWTGPGSVPSGSNSASSGPGTAWTKLDSASSGPDSAPSGPNSAPHVPGAPTAGVRAAVSSSTAVMTGAFLALALDSKPTALAFLPLLLALPRRDWLRAFLVCGALVAVAWLPFFIGAPHSYAAAQFTIPVQPASPLRWLGVGAPDTPPWGRPAQAVLGLALGCFAVSRGRWPAVVLLGANARIALDPSVYTYYTASVVLGTLLWDTIGQRRLIPWWTWIGLLALYVPVLTIPDDSARGLIRLAFVVVSTVYVLFRPLRRRTHRRHTVG